MGHYQLTDPRLAEEMTALAEVEAAAWPVTEEMRGRLATLLAPLPAPTPLRRKPPSRTHTPQRRAA